MRTIINKIKPWPQSGYVDDPDYYKALFDPYTALAMVKKHRDRIPELESIIATDPATSYAYAEEVLNCRFPKGEPAILRSPIHSAYYASKFLKRRSRRFEQSICRIYEATCVYLEERIQTLCQDSFLPSYVYEEIPNATSLLQEKGYVLYDVSSEERLKAIDAFFKKVVPEIKLLITRHSRRHIDEVDQLIEKEGQ